MAPLGYGVWTALKTNPALQWAVGIGVAAITFFGWLASRDRRIRREVRREIQVESLEQSDKIKQESNEKSKQVDIARRNAPRGVLNAGELPESVRARIFVDDIDGGAGSS